jgi:hypothetical protein
MDDTELDLRNTGVKTWRISPLYKTEWESVTRANLEGCSAEEVQEK